MYSNLKRELERKKITQEAIASLIGCTEKTVRNKLDGTSDFTVSEAISISSNFLSEFSISYLFTRSA